MAKVEKEFAGQLAESPNPANGLDSIDLEKLVKQRLDSLRRSGLTHLPKGNGEFQIDLSSIQSAPAEQATDKDSTDSLGSTDSSKSDNQASQPSEVVRETKPALAHAKPRARSQASDDAPYGEKLELEPRKNALQVLQTEVAGCALCPELASTRTQTVFGVGAPSARLVFLGEGPGANEDRLGEPFVGEAGQLLDKILGACGLSRSDVYILNAVKCRPPANRNPSQDELANCFGFAEAQLELLQPEFICCLGSVASRTLLKTNSSIGKLRKRFHTYRGSRVLVTYHPAYLLRTPSAKKHVWEDMKLLMKEMGIELPK